MPLQITVSVVDLLIYSHAFTSRLGKNIQLIQISQRLRAKILNLPKHLDFTVDPIILSFKAIPYLQLVRLVRQDCLWCVNYKILAWSHDLTDRSLFFFFLTSPHSHSIGSARGNCLGTTVLVLEGNGWVYARLFTTKKARRVVEPDSGE